MADGWWNLDGAITSCVAAYQAIGAASYAASKVNMANPGTYDLSGSDDPVFDTSYGWRFVSVDGAVVGDALGTSTAIPVTGTWSIFVRFTEAADAGRGVCYLLSAHYGGQGYLLAAEHNTWNRNIRYGANNYSTSGRLLTDPHVWGFAGKQAYLDGTANGAEMAESTQIANRIMVIGATNYDGAIVFKSNVKIQAISIYNETLTVQNVADLTTAMNALSGVVPTDLTAADFTLSPITFDAPTLTNVWVTPACRTFTVNAESRAYVIPKESRGLKILCAGNTTYAPSHTYSPLVAKDFTLAQPTFDAPYLGYSISGNAGVAGATVTFGAASVTSGVDGSYRFDGLPSGTKGTVTVTKTGYEFYPQRKYIPTIEADVTQSFTATQMTATYYVRKDGNDTTGDGSTGAPWLTIKKAYDTVALTGAAYIKIGAGTYEENVQYNAFCLSKNYTNMLVYEAESGTLGDVKITGTTSTLPIEIYGSHIRFRKLEFIESAAATAYTIEVGDNAKGLHYADFIDCRITRGVVNNATHPMIDIATYSADHIIIDGCDFVTDKSANCYIKVSPRGANYTTTDVEITGCTFASTGTTLTYAILMQMAASGTGKIDGVTITNCSIDDDKCSMIILSGVDAAAQGAIENVTIADCTLAGDNHNILIGGGTNGAVVRNCAITSRSVLGIASKECTDVEVKNCTVTGMTSGGAYVSKATTYANWHHNTATISSGVGIRNTINLVTSNKCSNCQWHHNTVICTGDAQIMTMPADAEDGGGNVVDYNTYTPGGSKKYGSVRADTDVQTFAELQAAWVGYGDGTNDSHSTET